MARTEVLELHRPLPGVDITEYSDFGGHVRFYAEVYKKYGRTMRDFFLTTDGFANYEGGMPVKGHASGAYGSIKATFHVAADI